MVSKAIETKVELANTIIKCVCVLHNIIIDRLGLAWYFINVTVHGETSYSHLPAERLQTEAKNIRHFF